jgi:sugar phosphate isomerase/epimerase
MNNDFSRFSFSTSWNWQGAVSGRKLIEEILDLGFTRVELNYKIGENLLAEILPMIEAGTVAVSSVHNVFPDARDPRFDPDSRLLGFEDDDLRARSIELTKRTIDWAARLGAGAVVVHVGETPIDAADIPAGTAWTCRSGREYDERLKALFSRGKKGTPEYDSLFAELVDRRSTLAPAELRRIGESLGELGNYIARKGFAVRIGIENRAMCHQIPDYVETGMLLRELEGAPIGPWFDMGHGAMMRHLGFFDDRAEISRIADRLVGVHIHDVDGVADHFAPYSREGLDPYLDIIERAPIRVLELAPKNDREAVMLGASRLAGKLRERAGR